MTLQKPNNGESRPLWHQQERTCVPRGEGRTQDTHQRVAVIGLRVHTAGPRQDQEALFRTGDLCDAQVGQAFALNGTDHIGIALPSYEPPSYDLLQRPL